MRRWGPVLVAWGLAALAGCGGDGASPSTRPGAPAAAPADGGGALGGAEAVARACQALADELAEKLSPDQVLAVPPMLDTDGGVRRLGVLAAEETQRALLARGLRLADRQHLNALLLERDLQLALGDSQAGAARAGAIARADVLVLGTLTDAGEEVVISAKAVSVAGGRPLAAARSRSLPESQLGSLMWYVRRPATPPAAGELPPLSVRCEFVTLEGGRQAPLPGGAAVASGQKFKVRLQANSDCYLYVLLYDSQGKAGVLFPHEKVGLPNRVRGAAEYEVPAGDQWYWFDQRPGEETFYVVASYTELGDLDGLLARMEQAGGRPELAAAAREHIDQRIARGMSGDSSGDYVPKGLSVRTRGVGGVTDIGWGAASAQPADMDNVVVGHATAVKKVVLHHR